jgi:hypothetical protein
MIKVYNFYDEMNLIEKKSNVVIVVIKWHEFGRKKQRCDKMA